MGLVSLYVLSSQYRSCDDTLENFFFQSSYYSRPYVRMIYEKTKGQVPLRPLLGKQNIQAKEVYWEFDKWSEFVIEVACVAHTLNFLFRASRTIQSNLH